MSANNNVFLLRRPIWSRSIPSHHFPQQKDWDDLMSWSTPHWLAICLWPRQACPTVGMHDFPPTQLADPRIEETLPPIAMDISITLPPLKIPMDVRV